MKATINTILPSSLAAEQRERCLAMATADAVHWTDEAAAGTLPAVEAMHLDWQIDKDLRDAGVDAETLQRLSFAFAASYAEIAKMNNW